VFLLQRNLDHPKMDGVSTNLALIFGTLLSSQGTDASFVLTLSGFPPGFPFVFPTLPDRFPLRFRFGFRIQWPVGGLASRRVHYVS
ncbi:hypothetical protein ACIQCR_34500, partial [Streptomyces sp. NPDC093249]|uniref:hypothetical protein n=1 Tax=unclassified Streptomyces TaxID=2593676 RepID=UPI00382155B4